MSRGHRTRAFFDRIARTYERNRYGHEADEWRRYFFGERLSLARGLIGDPSGRILDLGSGPGILGAELGPRVLSVDLSAAMLREADGDAVAGDAVRIPLRSGSVAAVCALGLTTYLEDLEAFFTECGRVLTPDGRLVFSITRRGAPDSLARAAARVLISALPRRGGNVLTAGLKPRAWSVAEVERKLRRRGFRLVAVRRHNYTVFPLCYLFRSASVRLGRRLERSASPAFDRLASDAVLLARKEERPARRTRKIRVVRVIARLNVGGPARQAILLTRHLPEERYDSTLVTGPVEPPEGDLLPLARESGVEPILVEGLGRTVSPLADLRAFLALLRILRAVRPDVVHTHTAKAGALGRVAAWIAGVPVRIHTFHGHVLHGYFGRLGSALTRETERLLARLSTRVVAVSPEVKDDLCRRHRAIPASRVEVVPLGLELLPLAVAGTRRGELRRELGFEPGAPIVGVVGRVTAIKDPELLLETAKRILRAAPEARFVVAGGGDLLESMRRRAEAMGLRDAFRFLGFRNDLDRIFADLSVALLTSRNEGTPVALIEAAAAGVPAVATRVGGVPTVVVDGVTGRVVPGRDPDALADAVLSILRDPDLAASMGAAARERALDRFGLERLLHDIDRLYRVSLARVRGRIPVKIYTKTGDDGETGLFGGQRVPKDDLRVAAYGEVDELNANLGFAIAQLAATGLAEEIHAIQSDLFTLGADLAAPAGDGKGREVRLAADSVARLEEAIDRHDAGNEPLTSFILPGGSPGAAALHVCRTVCRRAERAAVRLAAAEEIGPHPLAYLNRLSDLLFVLARRANALEGVDEPRWSIDA